MLLPAEGEGRNAVYAALKGWEITAFDYSEAGKQKALDLAKEYEVEIDYQIHDATDFKSTDEYDAIALVFAHFPIEERNIIFEKLEKALTPGGIVIMEVFSKNQLGRESGGPKSLDLLYSKGEIMSHFPDIDFMILEEMKITLNEGFSHQGEAAVIRAVGKKRD